MTLAQRLGALAEKMDHRSAFRDSSADYGAGSDCAGFAKELRALLREADSAPCPTCAALQQERDALREAAIRVVEDSSRCQFYGPADRLRESLDKLAALATSQKGA